MNARRRLFIAPSAQQDLLGIRQHIASDSTRAAVNQVKRILMHADMLRDRPDMGTDRTALRPSLRSVVERPYVIFYFPRDDRIEIVRVFHERQDIEGELRAFLQEHFPPPSPI